MGRPVIGVLGGMGGLASAAFVASLYRRWAHRPEAEQPRVWLYANPAIPDRTTMLEAGQPEVLAAALTRDLRALLAAGADRLIICCVSAHAVWGWLPPDVQACTLSLVEALVRDPRVGTRRRLVAATTGTSAAGMIRVAGPDPFLRPGPAALATIHQLIYALKAGLDPAAAVPVLQTLAREAGAEGVVAACTELHLVAPHWPVGELDLLDPLDCALDALDAALGGRGPAAP
ncbi:MAG: aspartate/glutamate racemase family protein [Myxococcales bacterium]|nr:aspartate/glutamate racemase family protein [Myxococcales bacterium]